MRTFKITRMSGAGDELVAEWTETTSPERLAEIEKEFNERLAAGYFAADLSTNELVREFKPDTDYLLIPRVQGGSK